MKDQTKRNLANVGIGTLCVIVGFILGNIFGSSPYREILTHPGVQDTVVVKEEVELSDWQIFQIALAKTESEFNCKAKGVNKDYGILQITPILVEEVIRLTGDSSYVHSKDSFNPEKSFEMFTIIQRYHNPSYNIDRAIKIWNPGGESIGYPARVYANIQFVKNYEKIRAIVK